MELNIPDSCRVLSLEGFYQETFGDKVDGSFVEVGAYDGLTFSNTSCWAEVGWRGLMFEPFPGAYAFCRDRYSNNDRIEVVKCCIGNSTGAVKLYLADFLSTTDENEIDLCCPLCPHTGEKYIWSEMFSLDSKLEERDWEEGFDLLVVDTKGTELDVLQGFDIGKWSPRVAIVDVTKSETEIDAYFAAAQYTKVWHDLMDTIYSRD